LLSSLTKQNAGHPACDGGPFEMKNLVAFALVSFSLAGAATALAAPAPHGARCQASLNASQLRFMRCEMACGRRAAARASFDPERCQARCGARLQATFDRIMASPRCADAMEGTR
jgi:hypothetical protein